MDKDQEVRDCPQHFWDFIEILNELPFRGDHPSHVEINARVAEAFRADENVGPSWIGPKTESYLARKFTGKREMHLYDLISQRAILFEILTVTGPALRESPDGNNLYLLNRQIDISCRVQEGKFTYEILRGLTILDKLKDVPIDRLGICNACDRFFWITRFSKTNPKTWCSQSCGSAMRVERSRRAQYGEELAKKQEARQRSVFAENHPTNVELDKRIRKLKKLLDWKR